MTVCSKHPTNTQGPNPDAVHTGGPAYFQAAQGQGRVPSTTLVKVKVKVKISSALGPSAMGGMTCVPERC